MGAKLIKVEDEWYNLLKSDGELIASDDEDFQHNYKVSKLSTKNCRAIERSYDLDELAEKEYFDGCDNTERSSEIYRRIFKEGFQKALELNADKRFTLKEMTDCWNKALTFQTHKETLGEHIQSLKQKEWDVEIEMEQVYDGLDEMARPQYHKQPKLDADGCLILKRK